MTAPNYSEMFQGEPQLVPGVIRGYRSWNCYEGMLTSTGVPHVWARAAGGGRLPPASVEVAECVRDAFALGGLASVDRGPRSATHEAPYEHCSCGIYGWYEPDDTRIVAAPVFGAIEVSGRVIAGTHGFRAQRARVLGLHVASGYQGTERALRERGYEVHATRESLLEQYPPDDVSALIDHTCDDRCRLIAEANRSMGAMVLPAGVVIVFSPQVAASAAAFRRAAEEASKAAARLAPKLKPLLPEEPPSDPRERALYLRRNRNTGPASPWAGARRFQGPRP